MQYEDFLIEEKEGEYHARSQSGEVLSSHKFIDYLKNPILYSMNKSEKVDDGAKAAYKFGSACHSYILEGKDAFHANYYVGEYINPTTGKSYGSDTKKYTTWEAEIGRPILNPQDFEMIQKMNESVKNHDEVFDKKLIGDEGKPEQVMRGDVFGTQCQIRMDFFNGEIITDLKTCDDLDMFEYSAKKYKYDIQLAFYQMVFEQIAGYAPPVYLVAVEKIASHRCGVWLMDQEMLNDRKSMIKVKIAQLQREKSSNKFRNIYDDLNVLSF